MLGDRSSVVFGAEGGSIGRSADNDWILPDPLRYISAHHARIAFRDGRFFLEDLSTNGSFVNDDEEPLAKRGPYALAHGDVLRLGEYQVVVTIDQEGASRDPLADPEGDVDVVRSAAPAQTDIGASLNLDELLVPDTSASGHFPVDAYGQRARAPRKRQPEPSVFADTTESLVDDDESEAIAKRIEKLAKAAARERKNGAGPALYDVHTGLQAFCRGAGIDGEKLPGDAQTRLLHLAGQLFREALLGVKDLDRFQYEERNRFRIELPVESDDTRPVLAASTIEDLLIEVMKQHESRRIDAVQWLRETMAQAKRHEEATAEAMRAAFVEFVDRLDPNELETRFERARKGKSRSHNWELYADFYRNLTEMPKGHLPHTFVEAFATAYRAALEKAAREKAAKEKE